MTEPSELRDSIDTLCRNFMGTNMDSFALSLLKEQIEQLVEPLQAANENLKSMVRQYELILEPADIYAAKEIDRLKREIEKITKP